MKAYFLEKCTSTKGHGGGAVGHLHLQQEKVKQQEFQGARMHILYLSSILAGMLT